MRIGKLESILEFLNTLHDQPLNTTDIRSYLNELDTDLLKARQQLREDTVLLEELNIKCKQQRDTQINREVGFRKSMFQDQCSKYNAQEAKVLKSAKIYSVAYSLNDLSKVIYEDYELAEAIDEIIKNVEKQIQELENEQDEAPILTNLLNERNISSLTDRERADHWVRFTFDSTDYRNLVDTGSDTYHTAFEFGKMAGLWSSRGEATFKCVESHVTKLVFNTHVKVWGKVLKVKISRHYTDYTLFTDPLKNLKTVK